MFHVLSFLTFSILVPTRNELKRKTLPTIGWHTSRERVCVVDVGCFDGDIDTHTELDGHRHERPRMNHSKYHTGMQQTK